MFTHVLSLAYVIASSVRMATLRLLASERFGSCELRAHLAQPLSNMLIYVLVCRHRESRRVQPEAARLLVTLCAGSQS